MTEQEKNEAQAKDETDFERIDDLQNQMIAKLEAIKALRKMKEVIDLEFATEENELWYRVRSLETEKNFLQRITNE